MYDGESEWSEIADAAISTIILDISGNLSLQLHRVLQFQTWEVAQAVNLVHKSECVLREILEDSGRDESEVQVRGERQRCDNPLQQLPRPPPVARAEGNLRTATGLGGGSSYQNRCEPDLTAISEMSIS